MMAYPALPLARLLVDRFLVGHAIEPPRLARAFVVGLTAGGALAAWDVFLDPQMVAAHSWTWRHPHPGLPGVHGVPLTNLAGWLLAATVLMTVVELALPTDTATSAAQASRPPEVVVPAVLLAWTWLGSVVGNAVFFDRPWVAMWGGLLLGAFVAPYLLVVRARWAG
jgi:uncharacterized membrane protein